MKTSVQRLGIAAAVAILSALSLTHPVRAQSSQGMAGMPSMQDHAMPGSGHAMPGEGDSPDMTGHHGETMQMHARHAAQSGVVTPAMPGNDAFGTIQEIVRILEADPKTDWSKVDLEALRQHLIDMNEVTLNAEAAQKPIEGGLEIEVTGGGRILAAIQRMVPAHAQEINGHDGWLAKAETLPNGVRLTVTSSDLKEVQHIRGLGFIGILVSGTHHRPHHLAMAKGELVHRP
jgi:hypothetical protein